MSDCLTPWKIAYVSRLDAKHVIACARGHLRGARPYRCPCGAWHLTSMSRNDVRRVLKRKKKAA